MTVEVCEDISKARHPYPGYHAIYFLTPMESSIDCLLKDMKEKIYSGGHVFFTAGKFALL